jgi:hypothetical protein
MSLVSFEKELLKTLGLENRSDVAEIQLNFVPGELPRAKITLTSIKLIDDVVTLIDEMETYFFVLKEE